MGTLATIHILFGERVLPVLIVLAAIYLTVVWKPGASVNPAARILPILVDIQVTLGLIYFVYMLIIGAGSHYMSFPFLLHPILGLLSAGVAHMSATGAGPFGRFGRWSALIGLVILLVLVLIGIMVAKMA